MQFQFFWQKYFLREKIKDASRVNIFGTLSLWPHPIPWENELKINHFSGLHLTVFEKKYDSPVMFQRKIKSLSVVLRNWWGSWFKYIWFYIYLECFYATFNFIGLMFLIRRPLFWIIFYFKIKIRSQLSLNIIKMNKFEYALHEDAFTQTFIHLDY